MKIGISGATGFIGSRFIEMFSESFSSIMALNYSGKTQVNTNVEYVNLSLSNYNDLIGSTKECEVFVHLAFDHNYKENIIGIRNLLKCCKENKIRRLIHISTVSVYDPNSQDELNESSCYSKLKDPYSKQKRAIEDLIYKEKGNLEIFILQPTIIYGLGGNWSKYAFMAAKVKHLELPNGGDKQCNAIYIDDIVDAIHRAILAKTKEGGDTYHKLLVSNDEFVSWKRFFEAHSLILENNNMPFVYNNIVSSNLREFHPSFLKNLIFTLWFETPVGSIFDTCISSIKRIRSKKYHRINNNFIDFLKKDINKCSMVPLGMTRKAIDCNFSVNVSNAKYILGFTPVINFDCGIDKMTDQLKQK